MEEFWGKLADQLGKRISDIVTSFLEQYMNRYMKGEIHLVFTEEEAAELLKISKMTLYRIREEGQINHSYYRNKPVYTMANLADYVERHQRIYHKPNFHLVDKISPLGGAEIKPFRKAS